MLFQIRKANFLKIILSKNINNTHPFLNLKGSSYTLYGTSFYLRETSSFINIKSTYQLHKQKMHVSILMQGGEFFHLTAHSHKASYKEETHLKKRLFS